MADLHEVIFDAFDRGEEHFYEFQIRGKGPQDPKAKRYGLSEVSDDLFDDKPEGIVTQTMLGSLGLKSGQVFGYWFDFGDDWWHQINVVDIEEIVFQGRNILRLRNVKERVLHSILIEMNQIDIG